MNKYLGLNTKKRHPVEIGKLHLEEPRTQWLLASDKIAKRLFRGSSGTKAGTLRKSIITVDSGRLCIWPVPVSCAGMAAGQQKRYAA